jgi:hypothetical protein
MDMEAGFGDFLLVFGHDSALWTEQQYETFCMRSSDRAILAKMNLEDSSRGRAQTVKLVGDGAPTRRIKAVVLNARIVGQKAR